MTAARRAHRYTAAERTIDRLIHLIGLVLGAVGMAVLLTVAAHVSWAIFVVSAIYATSLLAMLVCSTLYHHHPKLAYERFLRRMDHAAIFLLIAGTYTPFTVCRLQGGWALGLTAAVWLGALVGVAVKLLGPLRSVWFSTLAYIALGWIGVIGLRPILDAVDPRSLILLAVGGVVYSLGSVIHRWRSLRFHNAIWHAMVVAAAACQYAAVLKGVVLAGP